MRFLSGCSRLLTLDRSLMLYVHAELDVRVSELRDTESKLAEQTQGREAEAKRNQHERTERTAQLASYRAELNMNTRSLMRQVQEARTQVLSLTLPRPLQAPAGVCHEFATSRPYSQASHCQAGELQSCTALQSRCGQHLDTAQLVSLSRQRSTRHCCAWKACSALLLSSSAGMQILGLQELLHQTQEELQAS